jgi:hypothetical protein
MFEEQQPSSRKLQLQIQVRAHTHTHTHTHTHRCLLAIHSCFIASCLTINLDSLAMLPTLLLKLHSRPECCCTCSMFRHAVEPFLTTSTAMRYGSNASVLQPMSASCTQNIAKHALQTDILHFVRRQCVISVCSLPVLYLTTSAVANFIYVGIALFLLLCLGVKLGLAY